MRNLTVIFRVNNSCNLRCKYCYDSLNNTNRVVNVNEYFRNRMEDVVNYIDKLHKYKNQDIRVILHGGEPLLVRSSLYEEFFEKLYMNNKKIDLSVQTNGTLIDEGFIRIFNKYNVNIGMSLDGCNEQQNSCRIFSNGKNSFNKVLDVIRNLNSRDIRFGIIMTINREHINQEKELYKFIAENNLKCNIRPAFPTLYGDNSQIMTHEEYYNFMKNMFDIWYNDSESTVKLTQITELYEELMQALEEDYRPPVCSTSESCFGNFISLDIDGNIYTCNRLYNTNDFYLGNLNNSTLQEIMDKCKEYKDSRIKYILNSDCKECEMFKKCNGGCPANAYATYGDYKKADTYFCKGKIKLHNYIKDKLVKTGDILEYKNNKKQVNIDD